MALFKGHVQALATPWVRAYAGYTGATPVPGHLRSYKMAKKTPVARLAKALETKPIAAALISFADPGKLNVHPLAAATPEMPSDQIDALAADIKRNGQKLPIVMFEGSVLDGRARIRACIKAD